MKPINGLLSAFRAEQRHKIAAAEPVEWVKLPGVRQFPEATPAKASRASGKPAPGSTWKFGMMGNLVGEVWNLIDDLPAKDRPALVDRAFKAILLNLEPRTGRILLTREEFAAAMRCPAAKVGAALCVLVRLGAVRRVATPVLGVRGPGEVRYFINPDVAWNGSLRSRAEAAARYGGPLAGMEPVQAPALRLVERMRA